MNGLQTRTGMCLVKRTLAKGQHWILWPAVSLHFKEIV